jgi:probable rRNA maturation factor
MLVIEITNLQSDVPIEEERLCEAVRSILEAHAIEKAQVSVAVVDDPAIAALHLKYLDDADPTDVLSFLLESTDEFLEGEIVVSADTAAANAPQYGWSAANELLLYVIHGTLHLVGYDDGTPEQQTHMRAKEREFLGRFGLEGKYEHRPVV